MELIFDSLCRHIDKSCKLAENIADDLISNGVTVQESVEISDELLKQLKNAPNFVQKTNADKIRSMNDEELAKVMERMLGCPVTGDCKKMLEDCNDCWLDWLKQPAE